MLYKKAHEKENRKTVCVLNETGEIRQGNRWMELILSLCFLVGFFWSVQDLAYSEVCVWIAMITGAAVILIQQIFAGREKILERFRWALYIVGIGCFVAGLTFIVQGFLFTVNLLSQLWNLRFHTEFVQMQISSGAGTGSALLWGLAGLVVSSFLASQIRGRKIYGFLLTALPAVAFGYILGQSDMWIPSFLFLAGIPGLMVFYSAPWRKLVVKDGFCTLLIAGLVLVMVSTTAGYHQIKEIEKWKQDGIDAIDEFRYGKDTLPEGDLTKAGELLAGSEDRLKITMEHPEELYLRGFVGGAYQGNHWSSLSASAYEGDYAGMLDWLSGNGLDPLKQYATYDRITSEVSGKSEADQQISVENIGAYRKYLYLPSQVESWSGAGNTAEKDQNVTADGLLGASSYKFRMARDVSMADNVITDSWVEQPSEEKQKEYLNAESVYHSFVKEKYLDVENELKPVLDHFFFQDESLDKADFSQVTTTIRQQLRMDTDYTELPETVPAGEDYVKWFLEDQKSGNATAFASAAVLAYREAGYPARYVEGYHLTAGEAEKMTSDGKNHIALTTGNAHAWVEVYMAGTGWLPVEVVPGFYVETYSDQIVEGRPAYKIDASADNSGIRTEDQNSIGAGNKNDEENPSDKNENRRYMVLEWIILISYLLVIVYLILELQRFVRLSFRSVRIKRNPEPEARLEMHLKVTEELMRFAGIRGDYSHPVELWEEVKVKFPDISEQEYMRVVRLLQKARFGGIELEPYEYHTLECYRKSLCNGLYNMKGRAGRLALRYVWAIPKFTEE